MDSQSDNLYDKLQDLNNQIDQLSSVLDNMAEKLTRIEAATKQIHKDLSAEIQELQKEKLKYDHTKKNRKS